MSEWVALNAHAEGEECPDGFPWFPYLFFGGCGARLDIHSASEAECVAFIREEVIPAGAEQ